MDTDKIIDDLLKDMKERKKLLKSVQEEIWWARKESLEYKAQLEDKLEELKNHENI